MLRRLISISVTVSLLAAALFILDFQALSHAIRQLDPLTAIFAILASIASIFFLGLRWTRIIAEFSPLPWHHHLRYFFVGNFLNSFTPGNLGGDIYRIVVLKKPRHKTSQLVSSILVERVWGLFTYILMYVVLITIAFVFNCLVKNALEDFFLTVGMIMTGALTTMVFVIVILPYIQNYNLLKRHRIINNLLSLFLKALHSHNPGEQGIIILLSVVSFWFWVFVAILIAENLSISLSWVELGLVAVLVELLRMVPISVQGIGVRETTYAYLVGALGENVEAGFVLGATIYLILTFTFLISGLMGQILGQYIRDE